MRIGAVVTALRRRGAARRRPVASSDQVAARPRPASGPTVHDVAIGGQTGGTVA